MNRPRIAQRAFVVAAFVLACAHAARAGLTLGPRVSFDHGYTYEAGYTSQGQVLLAREPGGFLVAYDSPRLVAYHVASDGTILDRKAHAFDPGWRDYWLGDISDLDGVGWKIVGGRQSSGAQPEKISNLSLFNADPQTLALRGAEIPIVTSGKLSYPSIHWTGSDHLVAWLEDDDGNGRSTLWMRRVSEDGALVDSPAVAVAPDSVLGAYDVAVEGTRTWVAWADGNLAVRLQQLDETGQPKGNAVLAGRADGTSEPCVGVARLGGRTVVAWTVPGMLRCVTVDDDGTVNDWGVIASDVADPGLVMAVHEDVLAIGVHMGALPSYVPEAVLVRMTPAGALEWVSPPQILDPIRESWSEHVWNARLSMDCVWSGSAFAMTWDFEPPLITARLASGPPPSSPADCWNIPHEPALLQLVDPNGAFRFADPLRANRGWGISAALVFWNGERFVVDLEDGGDPGWLHATQLDIDGNGDGVYTRFGEPAPRSTPCQSVGVGARRLRTRGFANLALRTITVSDESGGSVNYKSLELEVLSGRGDPSPGGGAGVGLLEGSVGAWDAAPQGDTRLTAYDVTPYQRPSQVFATYSGAHSLRLPVISASPSSAPTTIGIEGGFLLAWIESRDEGPRLYKALLNPDDANQYQIEGEPVLTRRANVAAPRFIDGPDGEALLLYTELRSPSTVEIRGVRFDRLGQQIDADGFSIATSSRIDTQIDGVWDGNGYAVFWNDRTPSEPNPNWLEVTRVTREGDLLDRTPMPLANQWGNVQSVASDQAGSIAVAIGGRVQMLYDDGVVPIALSAPGVTECEAGACIEWVGRSIDETGTLLRAPAREDGPPPTPPIGYQPVAGLDALNGIGPHHRIDRTALPGECYAYTVGVGLDGPAPSYSAPRSLCLSPSRGVAIEVQPNPSRAAVLVRCLGMNARTDVDLEVHDVGGRLVRRMTARASERGIAEFVWDRRDVNGREVSASIYWLRVADHHWTGATPVILLR